VNIPYLKAKHSLQTAEAFILNDLGASIAHKVKLLHEYNKLCAVVTRMYTDSGLYQEQQLTLDDNYRKSLGKKNLVIKEEEDEIRRRLVESNTGTGNSNVSEL
jgi:hypothetical protein